MIQDTSLEAYIDTEELRSTQAQVVLRCIQSHPEGVCDLQIYEETLVPIHLVPARRNELINEGKVCRASGSRVCMGRRRCFWYPLDDFTDLIDSYVVSQNRKGVTDV